MLMLEEINVDRLEGERGRKGESGANYACAKSERERERDDDVSVFEGEGEHPQFLRKMGPSQQRTLNKVPTELRCRSFCY